MSSDSATPIQDTDQQVSVNLDNVPSVPEKLVKTTTISKKIVILIVTAVFVVVATVITVPTTLALTHTGPFATTTATSLSTSTATAVTSSTTVASTTAALPSSCSSYTTITDATRLQTAAGGSACDQSLFSSSITWVRFSGGGGSQLATSAPGLNQCGTQASGWYSGLLPASGVTVNGTVCYQWNSNTCNWSNSIIVTNCGSFYVFGLIAPPVCNARYCTA